MVSARPHGNGVIDSGKEMFGDIAANRRQRHPMDSWLWPSFDKPENGGNGDVSLTPAITVFAKLRLWQDKNHDGISQPGELFPLSALGIDSLDLSFHESKFTDAYGNQFRFRAEVDGRQARSRRAVGL